MYIPTVHAVCLVFDVNVKPQSQLNMLYVNLCCEAPSELSLEFKTVFCDFQ